ncbi:hypothetical protein GTP81_16550 [Rugamonas sp. FT107W]|uniref:Abi-like protein n=1 Tax=Duganella vulcania TaxID=2692166 RepID=A0A845HGC6_9BURK|nr:Abi family protein [Duganella vulcania]MYN18362.1 hypothetical protein [Duganella vulcania]
MLKHLTAPRLATIQAFFKTQSDKDILGCYAWNQAVGAGLLPILGDFEVSFRNALHRALSQHFGGLDSYDWMMPRPNPAHAVNPAAPALLPARHKLNPKSKEDVNSAMSKTKGKKPSGYVVTPDDVVAALPFGFWEVLISGLSHSSQPAGLQAAILAAVFPHAPNTLTVPYGDPAFRKRVLDLLKRFRDVRNRIGHHDSLWATPEFNCLGALGLVPRRPRHTVNSLKLFADNVCWFAGWIDPQISAYIKNSDHWWSLQALLHRQALVTYRELGGVVGTYRAILDSAELPLRSAPKSLRKPQRKFLERLVANRHFY